MSRAKIAPVLTEHVLLEDWAGWRPKDYRIGQRELRALLAVARAATRAVQIMRNSKTPDGWDWTANDRDRALGRALDRLARVSAPRGNRRTR